LAEIQKQEEQKKFVETSAEKSEVGESEEKRIPPPGERLSQRKGRNSTVRKSQNEESSLPNPEATNIRKVSGEKSSVATRSPRNPQQQKGKRKNVKKVIDPSELGFKTNLKDHNFARADEDD